MHKLEPLAEMLVSTRIPGQRKGLDKPAYLHSFHVRDLLREAGEEDDVCVAGLLHDIVEDGATSLEDLRREGFSERVVGLVFLCSHDETLPSNDGRWVDMMAKLVRANNRDAWAIKVADLTSNITDSAGMPPDRRHHMLTVKVPLMLKLTREILAETSLWRNLERAAAVAV